MNQIKKKKYVYYAELEEFLYYRNPRKSFMNIYSLLCLIILGKHKMKY